MQNGTKKKLPFWKRRPEYDLPLSAICALFLGAQVASDAMQNSVSLWDALLGFAAVSFLFQIYLDTREIVRQLRETKRQQLEQGTE